MSTNVLVKGSVLNNTEQLTPAASGALGDNASNNASGEC